MKTVLKLALVSLLLGVGGAQATLVNFTLTGTVDFADGGNAFGLSNGSNISASGTFDDGALSGSGAESVSFGSGSGNNMTLVVGSLSFNETDDTDFGSGKPELSFFDGDLDGLSFATTFGSDGYFDSLFDFFEGQDDSFNLITGTWDVNSFSTTPVPVPAAVWLFGSGLIGLVGVARRKRV